MVAQCIDHIGSGAGMIGDGFLNEDELDAALEEMMASSSDSSSSSSSEEEEEAPKCKRCRRRTRLTPNGFEPEKEWRWKAMLSNPDLHDSNSHAAKQFRLRFRTPFPVFQYLIKTFVEKNWLQTRSTDCAGRPSVPFEVKVLAALRHLGRGLCFDDLEELSGVGNETLRIFTMKFFDKMAGLYKEWVYVPTTDEEIRCVMRNYDTIGVTGCLGRYV